MFPRPAAAAPPAPPNWNLIGNALNALGQEVALLANVNPIPQLNALMVAVNNIALVLNAQTATLAAHTASLAAIQQDLALQPMRIANASASLNAPLIYPAGQVAGGVLPVTKHNALLLNGAQAAAASLQLNLPNIPIAAAARITQFLNYMGIRL